MSLDFGPQVLSREPLTGRCYWECEWSGEDVCIGVAYRSINREVGSNGLMGSNDLSWSLVCSFGRYSVRHKNFATVVPVPPSGFRRVGVFLEREAGTLSFYSVDSDTHTRKYTNELWGGGVCVVRGRREGVLVRMD